MPIKIPWGTTEGLQTRNIGKPEAAYVAAVKEDGDNVFHRTTLSLTGALPAIAGGANLAVGRKIYTFPHAGIRILSAYFNGVAITQTEGNIDDDTPDVGLGTTIASGVVATLDGTAAFENVLTGQTLADCDGTAKVAGAANTLVLAKTTAAYAVHLNVADGWAASGDAGALISGDVVITWEYLG